MIPAIQLVANVQALPGEVPVRAMPRQVSSVACLGFGCGSLDRLYFTSAPIGPEKAALTVQASAGGLFMCRPRCRGTAKRPFLG